jgi:hypothetical protein
MRREERGITWVAAARVLAYKLEAWKAGLGAITAATVTLFYEHAKCHSDYANERFNPQRTLGFGLNVHHQEPLLNFPRQCLVGRERRD